MKRRVRFGLGSLEVGFDMGSVTWFNMRFGL